MSRFFKSAAFPILIVVVLAFFAQRLISPGTQEQPPSYGDFVQQLQAGQVKTADLKTKDNTITVKLANGQQYETGYPPEAADRLDSRLAAAKQSGKIQDYDVEGTKSNGWLSLLTKPERRTVELPTRYIGFEIPDKFAIGYGLDHAERYRNLPYVAALSVA